MTLVKTVYENFTHDIGRVVEFLFFKKRPVLLVEKKDSKPKVYGEFSTASFATRVYEPSMTYIEEAILIPEAATKRIEAERMILLEEQAHEEKKARRAQAIKESQAKADALMRIEQENKDRLIEARALKDTEEKKRLMGMRTRADEEILSNMMPYQRRMLTQGECEQEALMAFFHIKNCPHCGTSMAVENNSLNCFNCMIVLQIHKNPKTLDVKVVIGKLTKADMSRMGKLKKEQHSRKAVGIAKFQQSTCAKCSGYMEVQSLNGSSQKRCRNCGFEARTVRDVKGALIDIDVISEGSVEKRLVSGDMATMTDNELDDWATHLNSFFD